MVFSVSFNCKLSPRTSTVIFRRQVAAGNGRRDFRDVAHPGRSGVLAMKFTLSVRSFLGSADAGHLGLTAKFAFRPNLASYARHFAGETR